MKARFSWICSGQPTQSLQDLSCDVEAGLLDLGEHGVEVQEMTLLPGQEEHTQCPPDREVESRGALPGGQVVNDHLKARMLQGPGQDLALTSSEIPSRDNGLHRPGVLHIGPAWTGEPLARWIGLWARVYLTGDSCWNDQGLGENWE